MTCKLGRQRNYPLPRIITVTLKVQLYLNCSPPWIFFFEHSRDIFFKENFHKVAPAGFLRIKIEGSDLKPSNVLGRIIKHSQIFQFHFPANIDLGVNFFF